MAGSENEATLTQSAFETLRRRILTGELAGGAVVTERRLAEQLGLSRTPVRAAIGRLEGEGYLRRDGRVIIVSGVAVEEVMEILSVRRMLEVEAAREAAGRLPADKAAAIRAAIEGMKSPEEIRPEHHWSVDDLVHLSIAEATGNRLLVRLVSELRERTRMFGLSRIPSRFEPGKEEHLAIVKAIAEGDAEAAGAAMALHLDNARAGILRALSEGRRW